MSNPAYIDGIATLSKAVDLWRISYGSILQLIDFDSTHKFVDYFLQNGLLIFSTVANMRLKLRLALGDGRSVGDILSNELKIMNRILFQSMNLTEDLFYMMNEECLV